MLDVLLNISNFVLDLINNYKGGIFETNCIDNPDFRIGFACHVVV